MAVQSKVASLPPWGYAVAGATGAVLANALVYPLDIVKTRLQVQIKKAPKPGSAQPINDIHAGHHHKHYNGTLDAITSIVEEEGISGLYSGMAGCLIGVASTNFAYFYWYSIVRSLYLRTQTVAKPPGTAIELGLGAIAGALAQLFTIPVSVVTTRQQTQPKHDRKGLLATAKEVIDGEDGWRGLWRGLKASLVLVINPSITYGAYQRLKVVLFPDEAQQLRPHEAFMLGALSKAMATFATQPLIVAKVGLQSRPPPARNGKPFKSFIEVMAFIIEHEGVMSLFKGIAPQLLKGLLVQGILMMTKERMELTFILLFRYLKQLRQTHLRKIAELAQARAKRISPILLK